MLVFNHDSCNNFWFAALHGCDSVGSCQERKALTLLACQRVVSTAPVVHQFFFVLFVSSSVCAKVAHLESSMSIMCLFFAFLFFSLSCLLNRDPTLLHMLVCCCLFDCVCAIRLCAKYTFCYSLCIFRICLSLTM